MKRSIILMGCALGFLTGLVTIAVSFIANGLFSLPFLPFDLFEGFTRLLPVMVIESGIQAMVSVITVLHLGPTDTTAKLAEQLQGLGLILITGVVFGLVLSWIGLMRRTWLKWAALVGGVLLMAGMVAVEFILPQSSVKMWIGLFWLLILITGWCFWLVLLIQRLLPLAENPLPKKKLLRLAMSDTITRRNFLAVAWSSLIGLLVLSVGLGKNRPGSSTQASTGSGSSLTPVPTIEIPFGAQYTSGPAASPTLTILANRIAPAPGTEAEVTAVSDFYRVDINLEPPQIDESTWLLPITGLIQNPMSLSLNDLLSLPAESQGVTIACISNLVAGSLVDSDYWTGVPLKTILDMASLQTGATAVMIKAADGFYDSLPLSEAMDERTLLVYAMNGQALPVEHGFPLRIYIPGHYGMKLPKWITGLEVISGTGSGFWEDRGWSQTAIPQTTSWFDTRTVDPTALAKNGVLTLGGYAWAGDLLISKVELQFGTAPWVEAELIDPPISPLTWTAWRYDWKPSPGSYQVKVRATDGNGTLQNAVNQDPFPEGATGLDVVNFVI